MIKETKNKENGNVNINRSNDKGNINSKDKSDYNNQSKNSNYSSNLSFNLSVIQEKLEEIEEIISQKKLYFNKLSKKIMGLIKICYHILWT